MNVIARNFLQEGILVCPNCRGQLQESLDNHILCLKCLSVFLIAGNIPLLLYEDSVFTGEQLIANEQTYFSRKVSENKWKQILRRKLPSLGIDYSESQVDALVKHELPKNSSNLKGLVIGAGECPDEWNQRFPEIDWLVTDVDLSYEPHASADALALPIRDASFDIVVAEMVLEHVMNITRAAEEIERVCCNDGIILIKIPFCFPLHGTPYDFFRCTPSGLRALFRSTKTIYLDVGMGSYSALAYNLDSLLVNMTSIRTIRWFLAVTSRFLFGWLKWLDRYKILRGRALIISSGITFVGRRINHRLSAHTIIDELKKYYERAML